VIVLTIRRRPRRRSSLSNLSIRRPCVTRNLTFDAGRAACKRSVRTTLTSKPPMTKQGAPHWYCQRRAVRLAAQRLRSGRALQLRPAARLPHS